MSTNASPAMVDRECRRLADALEQLTVNLCERPDLAAVPDPEGLTIADHLERLTDWLQELTKSHPTP